MYGLPTYTSDFLFLRLLQGTYSVISQFDLLILGNVLKNMLIKYCNAPIKYLKSFIFNIGLQER